MPAVPGSRTAWQRKTDREERAAWANADVRTTERGAGRSSAKFHWPDPTDRAMCCDLPLALFGEVPRAVTPDRRCKANGCRQQWGYYDEVMAR